MKVKKILKNDYKNWYKIVKDILLSEEFQKRKIFKHHEHETVYTHSILVSAYSYKIAKKCKVNLVNCSVAGILHDFYTKAWLYSPELEILEEKYRINFSNSKSKNKFLEKHGFTHPLSAAENSLEYYPKLVNDKILSSIRTHMFPLSIFTKYKFPKYKESWIIIYADKIVSLKDFPKIKEIPKYIGLVKSKK